MSGLRVLARTRSIYWPEGPLTLRKIDIRTEVNRNASPALQGCRLWVKLRAGTRKRSRSISNSASICSPPAPPGSVISGHPDQLLIGSAMINVARRSQALLAGAPSAPASPPRGRNAPLLNKERSTDRFILMIDDLAVARAIQVLI